MPSAVIMKFPRKPRGTHRQVETAEIRMEDTRALADILLGVHGQDLTVVLRGLYWSAK